MFFTSLCRAVLSWKLCKSMRKTSRVNPTFLPNTFTLNSLQPPNPLAQGHPANEHNNTVDKCLEWCVGGVGRLCLEWCVGVGKGYVWCGVLEEWEGYVWNGVLEEGKVVFRMVC